MEASKKGIRDSSDFPWNRCLPVLRPSLNQLWTVLPFFLLLIKGFLFPLPLLDFWWHLKMGQVILNTGTIPRIDIFSFTAAGKPFIVQNWMAEILFYLDYKAGGPQLLVLSNAVLLVAALVPIYALCRKASNHFFPAVFASCIVVLCIPCNLRPQVFSYLMFAVFYWILSSYGSKSNDHIWCLPFLMVFWVNLHGAFVMGLALTGIFLFCESARSLSPDSPTVKLGRKQLGKLALVFGFCILATLVNPEKLGVYNYLRTVLNDAASQRFVLEWQPPTVNSIQGIAQFYLPFFLVTLALIASQQRPTLTELTLYGGFAVFGLTALRNGTWFLLISTPILARHIASIDWSLFPKLPASNSDSAGVGVFRRKEHRLLNASIMMAGLILVVVQTPFVQQRLRHESLMDPETPVGAMDYIEKHQLSGNIFHPQIYGDYLIWRLWPKNRSFFDGRVHLFGETFVRTCNQIYNDTRGLELLKDYDIRFLVLSKDEEKPGRTLVDGVRSSGDWKVLYEDNISILFQRVPLLLNFLSLQTSKSEK